jgi:hypothetical protein
VFQLRTTSQCAVRMCLRIFHIYIYMYIYIYIYIVYVEEAYMGLPASIRSVCIFMYFLNI